MVLALRVGDDDDNMSELSNIISVKAVEPAEEDSSSNMALIIGLSVGGAVLLLVIIAVAVICVRRNSDSGKIV